MNGQPPPRLGPESPLEDVRDYLRALRDEVADLDAIDRATWREQAVADLSRVEVVGSPARMVDAALANGSPPHEGDGLQGKGLALEDPEPWPEPVDGAELLSALVDTFNRFLALPDGADVALALWTVLAHAFDAFPVCPVCAATSPEKRCGKTTLLELLSALVPRPLPASNVTAATVFRAVERWQPTLLIDEADTFLRDGSRLRGILNSGHRRNLAYVVRTVGDDHEPRTFRTWAPKAVALIGELPDTLADRSVEVRMRRRAPDEEVEELRLDRLEELEPHRRQAWTWARSHEEKLEASDPDLPSGLHDRQRDNWRPLVAIADAAGGPWPERARKAARTLSGNGRDDSSLGTQLLADVRSVLQEHSSDRIRSKLLVNRLVDLEEAPWSEYKGRGLSTVSLANFLRPFGISSKDIRFPTGVYKGYETASFADAFRRYLDDPPLASGHLSLERATTLQAPEHKASERNPGRYSRGDVAVPGTDENPHGSKNVAGVAGEGGKASEVDGEVEAMQTSLKKLLEEGE